MTLALSLEKPDGPDRPPELTAYLRRATAACHEQLEQSLDLLGRIADRHAFGGVLERFYGFHLVWEDAIRTRADFRDFHAPRGRLPHLRHDLAALGLSAAEIDRLPACAAASSLAHTAAAALGSVYVMEGSTLGGQVIGRALAASDWPPPEGLRYFAPYGARTGQMWRGFRTWAQARPEAADPAAVAAGATATFDLLRGWLSE